MKDGPSEIAIFKLPSGVIFALKSPLDAPLGAQKLAFCEDRPTKINIFDPKYTQANIHIKLVTSFWESWLRESSFILRAKKPRVGGDLP